MPQQTISGYLACRPEIRNVGMPGLLFIMCPQANNLNDFYVLNNLTNKAMMDIYTPRISASEVAYVPPLPPHGNKLT